MELFNVESKIYCKAKGVYLEIGGISMWGNSLGADFSGNQFSEGLVYY